MAVKQYLLVVLICISITNDDIGHLFMHTLTIHISSLEKYLFESLPILNI